MPVCCEVMRSAMHTGAKLSASPAKGKWSPTLTIRNALPRSRREGQYEKRDSRFDESVIAAAYVGRSVKGDDTPVKETYVAVFYCFDSKSVGKQEESGDHKIVAGYLLPSINPASEEGTDACTE